MDRYEKWLTMDFMEQMANIGGEVYRAIKWKDKQHKEKQYYFAEKALEFLDFTIEDPKNSAKIHELKLCKEELRDFFFSDNQFATSNETLMKYYDAFAYAL